MNDEEKNSLVLLCALVPWWLYMLILYLVDKNRKIYHIYKQEKTMSIIKINADMTEETLKQVYQHFENAEALMDFLTALSKEERIEMEKIKRNPISFIKQTQIHIQTHPEFMPHTIPSSEFDRLVKLHENLRGINVFLDALHKKVKDTITVLESDAYAVARLYYITVRNLAKEGSVEAERIHQELSHHFKAKHPGKKGNKNETEEKTG
jgi:hypothetical protein